MACFPDECVRICRCEEADQLGPYRHNPECHFFEEDTSDCLIAF